MAEKRKMRFTESELSLIKNTFAENDSIINTLRKIFIQEKLTKDEEKVIKQLAKKDVLALLHKAFIPTLDSEAPLRQMVDLYLTLDVKEKTPEQSLMLIKARAKLIKYLTEQIDSIGGESEISIKFKDLVNTDGSAEDVYIDFTVRNQIVTHIDQQCFQLLTLAGKKEETVEATRRRLEQNSTK